jgi:hypothetical protein
LVLSALVRPVLATFDTPLNTANLYTRGTSFLPLGAASSWFTTDLDRDGYDDLINWSATGAVYMLSSMSRANFGNNNSMPNSYAPWFYATPKSFCDPTDVPELNAVPKASILAFFGMGRKIVAWGKNRADFAMITSTRLIYIYEVSNTASFAAGAYPVYECGGASIDLDSTTLTTDIQAVGGDFDQVRRRKRRGRDVSMSFGPGGTF